MLTLALALAAASPTSSPALVSTAPWWEKVIMTISSDGKQQSCTYETSLSEKAPDGCEMDATASGEASGQKGLYTKMTFERRFSPERPDTGRLQPGDTLLGRQVMALDIDAAGQVQGCQVLIASGDVLPDYGCAEAKAERFRASARSAPAAKQAYMTILVYGHAEQLV